MLVGFKLQNTLIKLIGPLQPLLRVLVDEATIENRH